ncbi:MAG: hypothetical protein HUU55_20345 [Myxococcales bacterium]|nr:hypothetical protein [Myxococcales bacterium]
MPDKNPYRQTFQKTSTNCHSVLERDRSVRLIRVARSGHLKFGRSSSLLTFSLIFLLVSHATSAADTFDIEFNRLGTATVEGNDVNVRLNQVHFDNVVRDLGVAMAPKFMGPASTLGALGFEVGFELSWTDINETSTYWKNAVDSPDSTMQTMQIHLRKGLPFSLEVGGTITHLFNSELWGVGLDVKFAMLEGFRSLPDFAIRGNIHTILGANDINILLSGGDAVLSKEFGIGGVLRVAPYIGYNLVYIHGSSHAITFFTEAAAGSGSGGCPNGTDKKLCSRVALFDDVDEIVHRGIIGFQLVTTVLSVGFEIAIAKDTQTYTTHLGVEF